MKSPVKVMAVKNKSFFPIPIGVAIISLVYIFGAMILLAALFLNPVEVSGVIAERHGLASTTGSWILIAVAALALIIGWGLFSMARWGFLLTIAYLLYFGSIGFILSGFQIGPNLGNFFWSLLVIVYLLVVRKRFFKQAEPLPQ